MSESNAIPPPFMGSVVSLPPLTVAPSVDVSSGPPTRLIRLLVGLAVTVFVFDVCFWGVASLGFSVGIFALMLAGVILLNRDEIRWTATVISLMLLLFGAIYAAFLETGTTNILSLSILLLALAGHSYYGRIESPWGRLFSEVLSLCRADRCAYWLAIKLERAATREGSGLTQRLKKGLILMLPALILALVFGILLSSGNAVFGNWSIQLFDWLTKQLALYVDAGRIALWILVAFLILPLLRPLPIPTSWWVWTEKLPRLPEWTEAGSAYFSSAFTLLVLNILFFVANYSDALFLWSKQKIPDGVDYKQYVHEGVNALIITVVLTAIVLTFIFQQVQPVTRRLGLRLLAYLWIAQNLFLLASVWLRLKLYIDAEDMTIARYGVMIFLVLVAAGYGLLTLKIALEKSLSWLVGGCLIAIFLTFYVTQFLDLGGWAAQCNVGRWREDKSRPLNTWLMYDFGADAWPALREAHAIDPSIKVLNDGSLTGYQTLNTVHLAQFDWTHWREFSLRAWFNRGALDDKK